MKTLILLTTAFCGAASAQESGNRIAVPFRDPSQPRRLVASMVQGCFTIEGYDGKDVLIEPRGAASEKPQRAVPHNAEGMKRIEPSGLGVSIEEENNTVKIHSSMGRGRDLLVRVPFATSLKIECMNGGDIKVDRVSGDLELQNMNGAVTATKVSGSVIANSLNGRVLVTMDKVTPAKPMSFSSLNGDIDVSLPGDARGVVRMKTDHGDIYSDFDIQLTGSASTPVVEDDRAKHGKYRVRVDGATIGNLNGGGPDLTFKTFNGNIYMRKNK